MRNFLCLIVLTTMLALTACTAPAEQKNITPPSWAPTLSPLAEQVIVKVGMKQVSSDAGILVGMAKNYYRDLGIIIEPIQFSSGQEMINQLAAGQLDVGATVSSAGLFNAMSRDIPMKIVADKGINIPDQGYYRLAIRKDLENTIIDYRDLKDKRIAIVGTASLDEIALSRVLAKAGLTLNDVDVQVIRSFPDMLVSFSNKSIEAAMLIEPFITQGIKKALISPWKDPTQYDPHAQTALLVFGTSLKNRPEVADRFMTAYIKSVRDYNDAFLKDIDKAAMIDILCQYSVIKDPQLYQTMYPTGLNPDGYLKLQGIALDLDWYKQNNLLTADLALEDVVDHRYVDFALNVLGPY